MQTCQRCHVEQPLDNFHRDAKRPNGRVAWCKPCRRAYRAEWYARDPERHKSYSLEWKRRNPERWKDANRRAKYGMPYGDYAVLLEQQGGVCAVCGDPPGRLSLAVDHNHDTGQIRGLLCDLCNRGLGYFQDDPVRLERAAAYLHRGRSL